VTTRRIVLALFALVLGLGSASTAAAGAFIFAGENNGVDVVTHPPGYTGGGGVLPVTVCIDPNSANAAAMETPVQNIVDTWNALAPTSPNLFSGGANDIPSGQIDFESVALHELGHCVGLAHVNLATESRLTGADRNYTKSTAGAGGYDVAVGPDGIRGSSDDPRGDDVNLHWYRVATNDPFTIDPVVDASTYARDIASLPPGHAFAANADRSVASLLGHPNTESVMQQGSGYDEAQRTLVADDVATIRLGMSGLDRSQGTSDDYTIALSYLGLTSACDVVLDYDDAETGFASCQLSGSFISGDDVRITGANIFFNTGFAWHFTAALPPTTSTSTSSTSSSSSTSTSSSSSTSSSTSTSTSSSSTSTSPSVTSSTTTTSTATSTSTPSTVASSSSTVTSTTTSTTTSSATTSSSTSTTATTTSTSSSTTTSTVTAQLCSSTPLTGCIEPAHALVIIGEHKRGYERLKIMLKRFTPPLDAARFGDPVGGTTSIGVCLYDQASTLVSEIVVDRAGDRCGQTGRACWRRPRASELRYADTDLASHGVRRIILKAGTTTVGRIVVKAKNVARRGQLSMPTGVANRLVGDSAVTVQVITSDADCFSAPIDQVLSANGRRFKARRR